MEQRVMLPELLAPAGDRESFEAALAAGADAIYLAGPAFGARAYATNFTREGVHDVIERAHLYGRKVYVTVNTVVKEREFADLVACLDDLANAHADAVIVADLGVLALSERYPDMEFHVSTQMNILSSSAARTVQALGARRVILAREASLARAERIKREAGLPVEVFVHGALCVAYSGQCLLSSLQGPRSGNRGRCAQCCRQVYRFVSPGIEKKGYLLSMKDLDVLPQASTLRSSALDSLKIEGRMKKATYVAAVTASWRARLDGGRSEKEDMLPRIFSRGTTEGYLFDADRATVVNVLSPLHQGERVGEVLGPDRDNIKMRVSTTIVVGDGLRLVSDEREDALIVNDMYRVRPHERALVKTACAGDVISLKAHGLMTHGIVYRTTSRVIEDRLRADTLAGPSAIGITGVLAEDGDRLVLTVTDGTHVAREKSRVPFAAARSDQAEAIKSALQKTGGTPFHFTSLTLDLPVSPFLPLSAVNELRREALSALARERVARPGRITPQASKPIAFTRPSPRLIVRVRTEEQYQVSLEQKDLARETDDPELYHAHEADETLSFVLPRISQSFITPPGEEKRVMNNLDCLGTENGEYLNVTNAQAVRTLEGLGVRRIALSPELSLAEIKELVDACAASGPRPCLSLLSYGYPDAMITRFCPMRAYGSCAHCAEASSLIDHDGHVFPLIRMRDPQKEECYTRILFHEPLSFFSELAEIKRLGISPILSFTIESAAETRTILTAFAKKWTSGDGQLTLAASTLAHAEEGME